MKHESFRILYRKNCIPDTVQTGKVFVRTDKNPSLVCFILYKFDVSHNTKRYDADGEH